MNWIQKEEFGYDEEKILQAMLAILKEKGDYRLMDISQKIQKLYEQTGISPEVHDFGAKKLKNH